MYIFCSDVDDFLTKVTHIIRGSDHITNTAIQIEIVNALQSCHNKKSEIKFAHLPLFQSKDGKFSKRLGGFSIMKMR
jgi:glutamyl-tRNA synthetase